MAFGSDNKLTLEVTVDSTGAITGFKQLDKEIDSVQQTTQKASGVLDSFFKGLVTGGGIEIARRGIDALTQTLGALPDAIRRGSQVDDIVSSFEKLSSQAGATGNVLIGTFSKALGDTIPKVDLMKQANELLVGGLDPSKFELVAKAARALGETTGTDAKQGLEKLSDSLLRGNDRALKNLGIVIDNNKAYEDFARTIGTTGDKLSEEGKVLATREAVLKALAENQQRLGEVSDDAGDKLDQLTSALTNQKDEALQAFANNKELNKALDDLVGVIKKVDFKPIIDGLSSVISFTAQVTSASIPLLIDGFDKVARTAGVLKLALTEGISLSAAKAAYDFGELQKEALEAREAFKKQTADAQDLAIVIKRVGEETKKTNDQQGKGNKGTKEGSELLDQMRIKEEAARRAKEQHNKLITQQTEAFKETRKAILERNAAIEKAIQSDDRYKELLKKINDGSLSARDAQQKFTQIVKENTEAFEAGNVAANTFSEIVGSLISGVPVAAETILKFAEAQKKASQETRDNIEAQSDLQDILNNPIAQAIGSAGSSLIDSLFSGENLKGEDYKNLAGQTAGSIIKSLFADIPVVGDLLASLADNVTKSIIDLFGGKDGAGTKARKAIDKYFADLFKGDRLAVIINGELKRISDLVFNGTTLFGGEVKIGETGFDKYLQSLPAKAQAAFQGVGLGFATLAGQSEEYGQQVAAALANNIGGSLNNLQLLVEATGVSFEDLKKSVVDAFLSGKLTAEDALSQLNAIREISTKGIPDGVGLVKQAFDNLKAAGTKGGRALVDALQDIGFEAKELGIKTLPQLMDYLVNTGKVSRDEVQKLMDALAKGGIKSIDQLTKANVEGLLPTLAKLQEVKFPFAEAAKQGKEFADEINKIPDKKDVTVNIKVNASKEDRELISRTSNLPGSVGVPTR